MVAGIQCKVHPVPRAHDLVLQCTANMTPSKAPYICINANDDKVKATSCMLTTNTIDRLSLNPLCILQPSYVLTFLSKENGLTF